MAPPKVQSNGSLVDGPRAGGESKANLGDIKHKSTSGEFSGEDEATSFLRHYVFPSTLLFFCPPSMMLLTDLIVNYRGDLKELGFELVSKGPRKAIVEELWVPLLKAVGMLFPVALIVCLSLYALKRNANLQTALLTVWTAVGILAFQEYRSVILPVLNVVSHSDDATTYGIIVGFALFQLALLRLVPGARVKGPVTPKHNRPNYIENGLPCFFITLGVLAFVTHPASPAFMFPASIAYDHIAEIIGACNVIALTLCLLLNIKGLVEPTNSDVLNDQSLIMSFYWGRELHPEVWGTSVKQFTNCRFGMMGWPCLLLSYAAAQNDRFGYVSDAMLVSVGLQLIYIAKFFHWEVGYFATMDMQEDRAGFYICWGCLVWVPCLYTSCSLSLVQESIELGFPLAASIMAIGLMAVAANYAADAERKLVRETNAECNVWGKKPTIIRAKYNTSDGVEHSSILLVSGFWAIARHSHYLFELTAAFAWCVPASIVWLSNRPVGASIVPLSYFIFLVILLTDRSIRDDKRCFQKYGQYWEQYRASVPYKIMPGVF